MSMATGILTMDDARTEQRVTVVETSDTLTITTPSFLCSTLVPRWWKLAMGRVEGDGTYTRTYRRIKDWRPTR